MTILPLTCFPNTAWLALYMNADQVVIDLGEHYVKQSYRNRFDLLGSHGVFTCTARVEGQKGQKVAMRDIKLVQDDWQRVAFRGLTAGYARAPFFEDFTSEIESLIFENVKYLHEFNLRSVVFLLEAMGINEKHEISNNYVDGLTDDIDARAHFKGGLPNWSYPAYPQVFEDRFGFTSGLSGLDLLLNTGTEAVGYLPAVQAE